MQGLISVLHLCFSSVPWLNTWLHPWVLPLSLQSYVILRKKQEKVPSKKSDHRSFAMSAYIYRIDEGLQFCIKAIQDFAYSGFGGRGGKHGDIFWDNESYAIKHYLKMFAELASATLKQVADWFV